MAHGVVMRGLQDSPCGQRKLGGRAGPWALSPPRCRADTGVLGRGPGSASLQGSGRWSRCCGCFCPAPDATREGGHNTGI